LAVSVEFTATGVKVCVPSGFSRSGTNVSPRLAGSGHALPLGGLVTASESPRMKPKSGWDALTPISRK
jgi:hypothetical protein